MTTWADTKRGIHDFIVASTGLAANRVLWSMQGKPRPGLDDYIELNVGNMLGVGGGDDEIRLPDADSPSDLAIQAGQRTFMLYIRIFSGDYFEDGMKIQSAFRNDLKKTPHLKRQQLVNFVIAEPITAPLYTFNLEGVPLVVDPSDGAGGLLTLAELLASVVTIIDASGYVDRIRGIVNETDDAILITADPGDEFSFKTDDVRITMVETQAATDVAYRGDHGIVVVPNEVREDYHGTGALDVVLATHVRIVQEMIYIEKVEGSGTVVAPGGATEVSEDFEVDTTP